MMLARVHLYLPQPNYTGADSAATAVINSGNYRLLSTDSLNYVFLANSEEAILQLQTISTAGYYITQEGRIFIPLVRQSSVEYYLTSQLLGAFELGDQRKIAWVDSIVYNGTAYYYPYKYKVGLSQRDPNNITEYYALLRFSEQFLVRAEAEANGASGGLHGAIADLNFVRIRAG